MDKAETLNNVAKGTTGSKSEGKKEGCDEDPLVRHPSLNFQIHEQSEAAYLVSEVRSNSHNSRMSFIIIILTLEH